MWLQYGVDPSGTLVLIAEVGRGQTQLTWPYCGSKLTAKKGEIKEHHFAHSETTCRAVADKERDAPVLPAYDHFNLHLKPKELEALHMLWKRGYCDNSIRDRLEHWGLIKWNSYKGRGGGYEFTHLGKIPLGALSLMLFNQIQELLILKKLVALNQKAVDASSITESGPDFHDRLTDLRLYRAQLHRILSQTLYYLEVNGDGQTLYKIGVTTRPIEDRVAEVKQNLKLHFQAVELKILGSWPH